MDELLRLEGVSKEFPMRSGDQGRSVRAVDEVSVGIARGEAIGLVGESGCGKSTLARLALRLHEPTRGSVIFDGADITHWSPRRLLPVRRRMQAVFQDPYASLNSRFTIQQILEEPFRVHGSNPAGGRSEAAAALLSKVGLDVGILPVRPRALSGGQLQRVAIARALAVEPELIVADEATSALDVSIRGQVLNLLLDLQRTRGMALLFISHDIDVVGHIADRIAVMYLGSVVEVGSARSVLGAPLHPYTQALLSAVPIADPNTQRTRQRIILRGDPPSPAEVPAGCRFHPRCPLAAAECRQKAPPLRQVTTDIGSQQVACHFSPEMTYNTGLDIASQRAPGEPPAASADSAFSVEEQDVAYRTKGEVK